MARTCKLCKQAVTTEAASHQENIALERLLSLIALPCKDRYTEIFLQTMTQVSKFYDVMFSFVLRPVSETTFKLLIFSKAGCYLFQIEGMSGDDIHKPEAGT